MKPEPVTVANLAQYLFENMGGACGLPAEIEVALSDGKAWRDLSRKSSDWWTRMVWDGLQDNSDAVMADDSTVDPHRRIVLQ